MQHERLKRQAKGQRKQRVGVQGLMWEADLRGGAAVGCS